jgi:hypothetical protein
MIRALMMILNIMKSLFEMKDHLKIAENKNRYQRLVSKHQKNSINTEVMKLI